MGSKHGSWWHLKCKQLIICELGYNRQSHQKIQIFTVSIRTEYLPSSIVLSFPIDVVLMLSIRNSERIYHFNYWQYNPQRRYHFFLLHIELERGQKVRGIPNHKIKFFCCLYSDFLITLNGSTARPSLFAPITLEFVDIGAHQKVNPCHLIQGQGKFVITFTFYIYLNFKLKYTVWYPTLTEFIYLIYTKRHVPTFAWLASLSSITIQSPYDDANRKVKI